MSSPFCTPPKKFKKADQSPKADRILEYHGNLEKKFAGNTPHPLRLIPYSPSAPALDRQQHILLAAPDVRLRLDFSNEGLLNLGRPTPVHSSQSSL